MILAEGNYKLKEEYYNEWLYSDLIKNNLMNQARLKAQELNYKASMDKDKR